MKPFSTARSEGRSWLTYLSPYSSSWTRATDNPYNDPDKWPGAGMAPPHPPPFGELLRRHRLASGLSQEALAERAGLSVDAIGVLERGERQRPQRHTLRVLADALALGDEARGPFLAAARSLAGGARHRAIAGLPHQATPILGREADVETVVA